MDLKLAGRLAVITGASKGIGFAAAQRLALEGCNICMIARSADALEAAASKIRSQSDVRVTTLIADVKYPETAESILQACPGADILVNNSGDIPP